ncbi:uncharacterized protein JCM6883_002622 [Sporobolomyces salmoneus]|uniref:uncharacterized protein n=1 Tax=Sporobolomyces salmoneus TaxID=183962 RepID=UPI0031818369
MEAYLDGIPRSTSSSSLSSTSNPTPNQQTSSSSHTPSASTSSYWLGGISTVWTGLKAAAEVEMKGFLKAVTSNSSFSSSSSETVNTGEKRQRRNGEGGSRGEAGEAREKRRRIERDHAGEELLNDTVPPLMPPISPAPNRARYANSTSSASPETTRKRLRPYTDASYADELMYTDQYAPSHSKKTSLSEKLGGGLRSLSGKRRLDANGATNSSVTQDTGTTSALSTNRTRSLVQRGGGGGRENHHVKFAFPPTTTTTTTPGLAKPKSPTSRLPKRNEEQVGSMLMENVVGQVWKEAKEKEKTVKTQKRINDLEQEVNRLKTELSSRSQLAPPPLPAPPRSPFKSPRRSSFAPPTPPPAPPLPPVGRSHPVLFSARASLRATPPRPSAASQSQRRRASAIGGVQDMDAFLSELGEKRNRLRKVSISSSSEKEKQTKSKHKGDGELTEVLQKAFARKFAKTNGLASPSFDTPLQSSKSSSNLAVPQWSAGGPSHSHSLKTSRSHPTQLSSHLSPPPPPAQPIFSASYSSNRALNELPPRSTSLAQCTETTVFGQALTIDEPSSSSAAHACSRARSTSRSHPLDLNLNDATAISPSLSATCSLPSVPPEVPEPSSSLPIHGHAISSPARVDSSHRTPTTTPSKKRIEGDEGGGATQRLSEARKRTSLDKLPGLDAGRKRPITPGRSRSKRASAGGAGSSSPLVVSVKKEQEDEEMQSELTTREEVVEEESMLQGKGMRSPNPGKVFGKA